MKLLVTGGAGFVGATVTRLLLDAGHTVVVLDDLSRNDAGQVPPEAQFIPGRVQDVAQVLTPGSGFDAVLHFAGLISAGESMAHPELHFDANTRAGLNLLDAMRAAGVRRLIYSSTAACYGEPSELPLTERAIPMPINTYGASKLAVDFMISAEARAYEFAAVSLRYFNVAGASARFGEDHDPETHLVPLVLRTVAGGQPELRVYGTDYPTADGTAVRDYVHVEDLVQAHLLALEALEPGEHRILNLGSGRGYSVREVIEAVERTLDVTVKTTNDERRPGDPAVLVASTDRIAEQLGWRTERGLDQMIESAWTFLQAHPDGYA
jgi:UDP-glucose 4-epimerase